MAHYRKIDVAIWNDDKFSALKSSSKLAFLFLVSHPNMTGIGAMRATLPGLVAELGVSQKDFSDVFKSNLAIFSAAESCVFIPNFIKYQGCESLNVLKSWVNQIQFIPHGKTKDLALAYLYDYVQGKTEAFRLAYDEAYMKAYGQAFALPKAYPVSSKQLGKPAIKENVQAREAGLVLVDGKWHESDTGAEVANG
jgi:hypothetical protein